ncbi:MAG TPA: hypothetical protein DEB39_14045 [Planctomycetaceae bacterium]|nr:hypothetical protein [Planctomycetaceae bacterium]
MPSILVHGDFPVACRTHPHFGHDTYEHFTYRKPLTFPEADFSGAGPPETTPPPDGRLLCGRPCGASESDPACQGTSTRRHTSFEAGHPSRKTVENPPADQS